VTPDISARAHGLIDHASTGRYQDAHRERLADAYSLDRPDGYIGLAIAENKLVWDLLRPKLIEPRDPPHQAVCYDDMCGSFEFRLRLSEFMGSAFLDRAVDPAHVAVLAGAGSVLEILFFALADPGEAVLVPTPSYAGFWADLETRDELQIIPVHTGSATGFRLTTDLLDEAFEGADRPVRALLYTNPSNPTGFVAPAEELDEVIAWAEARDVHLVLDEIYALSVHGEAEFRSGASRRPALGPSTHVVWAFSKDFGASGLRCGVLVTENDQVMRSVAALAYWSVVSGDTQHLLSEMLGDEAWLAAYISGMRSRLRNGYERTTAALDAAGIPFVAAEAGIFLLLDMRSFMAEISWEAEGALWRSILEEANVNLTPGSACRIGEPGFMRLCFAAQPPDVVALAVERIGSALND
jgi:1-aminocyclopropane-1-carboxylate synthase